MFKNGVLCWEFCPNCDAKLAEPCGIGDEWDCAECGESGTREPGPYDMTFADWQRRGRWASWDWDTTESIPAVCADDGELAGEPAKG